VEEEVQEYYIERDKAPAAVLVEAPATPPPISVGCVYGITQYLTVSITNGVVLQG
jgi:hypothetical protein